MRTTDNFDLIASMLDFPTEDVFYFGQIYQRGKDNNGFSGDNRIIRDLYFNSLAKFREREDEIKGLCEFFGARAYINLNKRSKRDVAHQALKLVAERMDNGDYQSLRSVYATACGQRVTDKSKKWVLDIDSDEPTFEIYMRETVNGLRPLGDKVVAEIPTPNGKHLICKPFDAGAFSTVMARDRIKPEKYSLQKNNPTMLYFKFCC